MKGKGKDDFFFILALGYVVALSFFSLIGERGLLTSLSLWGEKTQLKKDITKLNQEIENMKLEIYEFKENPRVLYQFARENMNLQQDNEIQFVFGKKP